MSKTDIEAGCRAVVIRDDDKRNVGRIVMVLERLTPFYSSLLGRHLVRANGFLYASPSAGTGVAPWNCVSLCEPIWHGGDQAMTAVVEERDLRRLPDLEDPAPPESVASDLGQPAKVTA